MPHWPPFYENSGRIEEMLDVLGNPQDRIPEVIHITGTNGKGSVIAFLVNICKYHNVKAHSFTNPHILEFNENFILAGEKISDDFLYQLIEKIRIKLEEKNLKPSLIEFQTVLAFLAFSRREAEITIIESGMGAKNDPSNVIKNPIISVMTAISFDHEEFLGNNLELITIDKAHIIKNNKVIIAPQPQIVQYLIEEYVKFKKSKDEKDIELFSYQEDYDFFVEKKNFVYVDIKKEEMEYYDLPSLLGEHQLENLAIALTILKKQNIFQLDHNLTNQAIKTTKKIGRLEKVKIFDKKHKNIELFFDGAHNMGGALVLANWLKKEKKKKTYLIYGRTAGTKHKDFLKYFVDKENIEILPVRVKNEFFSEPISKLKNFFRENPSKNVKIFESLEDAMMNYLMIKKEKIRIVICGSLYLYRDMKEFLKL